MQENVKIFLKILSEDSTSPPPSVPSITIYTLHICIYMYMYIYTHNGRMSVGIYFLIYVLHLTSGWNVREDAEQMRF